MTLCDSARLLTLKGCSFRLHLRGYSAYLRVLFKVPILTAVCNWLLPWNALFSKAKKSSTTDFASGKQILFHKLTYFELSNRKALQFASLKKQAEKSLNFPLKLFSSIHRHSTSIRQQSTTENKTFQLCFFPDISAKFFHYIFGISQWFRVE